MGLYKELSIYETIEADCLNFKIASKSPCKTWGIDTSGLSRERRAVTDGSLAFLIEHILQESRRADMDSRRSPVL